MGRRPKPQNLKIICIRNIAKNMEKLWCADYYNNFHDQGTFLHVVGPFLCLPPDLIQELICCLVVNGWMKRYFLHMLIDGRMERLDLSVCKKSANKDSLINLVTVRCQKLTGLNISSCNQVSSRVLSDLVIALPNLTSLNLRHTKCSDQVLTQVGKTCKNLRELDIYGCPVTDMGIMSLCVSFDPKEPKVEKLYKLDIAFTAVTHKAVEIILGNCKNLQILHYPDTCAALYYMYTRGVFDQDNYREPLRLRTIYLSLMKDTDCAPNESLRISCLRCPNITAAHIHRGVTDDGVQHLAQLSCLNTLHLTNDNVEQITFECGLLPLLQVSGTNLQELYISEINFIDIGIIGHCCPKLRKFSCLVAGFDEAFFPVHTHPEITAVQSHFTPFLHLEDLRISIYTEENNFPAHFLRMLLLNATKLKELHLVQVQEFSDDLFIEILEQNPLSQLHVLSLERCNDINLDPIYDFCEAENDLNQLALKLCQSISRIDREQLEMLVEEEKFDLSIDWC